MKKQILVSFLARKTLKKKNGMIPVYCRIRYDNRIAQFNTKIDVFGANWDSQTTRVIGNNSKSVNIQLEKIRIDIIKKYELLYKTNIIITAKTILDLYKNNSLLMDGIMNVFKQHNKNMKSLIGIEYSKGSYKNYITTIKHLKNYIKTKFNTDDISQLLLFIKNFFRFDEIVLMMKKIIFILVLLPVFGFTQEIFFSKSNGEIIDQTYNAHPKTIYETVAMENPSNTTLILGDMAELGKDEISIHADVLIKLKEYEIFVTGILFKKALKQLKNLDVSYFDGLEDFPKQTLIKKLDAGKNLYFKGSRSSKMEQYLNLITDD